MKKIGTHNGIFHADDVFSAAILRRVLGEVDVIRTRNPSLLAECDIRVDVGGKSDEVVDFDHHQRGGAGARRNNLPYASAGLVWRKYGAEICGSTETASRVDEKLIQVIDASDCGVVLSTPKTEGVFGYSVSSAISSINPGWDEDQSEASTTAAFNKAVEIASVILDREISRAKGTESARAVVEGAIADAKDPRVVVLPQFAPWEETVVPGSPLAQYVVFPSMKGEWMCQCVPATLGSFDKRKALPKEWGGLRGADLAALTGVSDAVFCHIGLFICGSATREGAIKLASLAVEAEVK